MADTPPLTMDPAARSRGYSDPTAPVLAGSEGTGLKYSPTRR